MSGPLPSEFNAAMALLVAISDPDTAKARLKELGEAKVALDEAGKKAEDAASSARADSAFAVAAQKDAEAKLAEAVKMRADLTAREDAVAQGEAQLEARRKEFNALVDTKSADIDARMRDVSARLDALANDEQRVAALQDAATKLVADAKALKAEYEQKLANLRGLVEAPAEA